MHDPLAAMATFTTQRESAVRESVESGTDVDQLSDPHWRRRRQKPHGIEITQTRSRDLGIRCMKLRIVVVSDRGGDSPLGPYGATAPEIARGDNRHPAAPSETQRDCEPGDA
jgi:hypothetical protein